MNELELTQWFSWLRDPCTMALYAEIKYQMEQEAKALVESIPVDNPLQLHGARMTIKTLRGVLKYIEQRVNELEGEREGTNDTD